MDEQTAKLSVAARKAEIVSAPAEAAAEPPKPKAKRISAAPAAE